MFRSAMTRVRVIIVLFLTSLGTNCIGSSQFYFECHFFAEGYLIHVLVQQITCIEHVHFTLVSLFPKMTVSNIKKKKELFNNLVKNFLTRNINAKIMIHE